MKHPGLFSSKGKRNKKCYSMSQMPPKDPYNDLDPGL